MNYNDFYKINIFISYVFQYFMYCYFTYKYYLSILIFLFLYSCLFHLYSFLQALVLSLSFSLSFCRFLLYLYLFSFSLIFNDSFFFYSIWPNSYAPRKTVNLPRLTMSSCKNVSIRNKNTATLVLQEKTQERTFFDQHLNRKVRNTKM